MNTDTPAPVTAQPESLDAKIEAAKSLERKLWSEAEIVDKTLQPLRNAYSAACVKWNEANRRLEILQTIKKELGQ